MITKHMLFTRTFKTKKQTEHYFSEERRNLCWGVQEKARDAPIRSALSSQYCRWGAQGRVLGKLLTRSELQGPQPSKNTML